MSQLHLEIITPERIVYSDEVDMVVVPGIEGELGILPQHTPLFTQIKPGEIKIKKGNQELFLAVTGGFLDVAPGNKVSILADYAVRSEEVEIARAEEARKRAEQLMKEKKSREDVIYAEAELRKAILELKVARRKHAPKTPESV
ncbi:MAG: F0F1 ATP synthase subunit epsilon [bacterium]|nr:F0F1 ATP synthase subunit epsilon [bacterium]